MVCFWQQGGRGKLSVLTPVVPAVARRASQSRPALILCRQLHFSLLNTRPSPSIHQTLDPISVNVTIHDTQRNLQDRRHRPNITAWSEPFSTYPEQDSFTVDSLSYKLRLRDTTYLAHQPQHLLDRQDDYRRRAPVA